MNKIIYLDAAASALKPEVVINAERDFLLNSYANSGRGVCSRAAFVDDMVKRTRQRVADFINAQPEQIVFTANATDSLNRIVNIIIQQPWYSGGQFAVSDLDHHSARLPWEALLHRGKIHKMSVCDLDENFDIKIDSIPQCDYLIITAMSNVLGCAQDVSEIIRVARNKNPNVVAIVDASQYVVHNKIDVKELNCDFLVFSGHKIGADTGIGVLYIRDTEQYFPDKFGGGMVESVYDMYAAQNTNHDSWIYQNNGSCWVTMAGPDKWEAGTLPLTQIAGLQPAIDYLENHRPDLNLIKYMYDELLKNSLINILSRRDATVLTFTVDGMHSLDVGTMLGAYNICVRVGNMCAAWIHKKLGLGGTIRVSVGPWNTMDDAKTFVNTIQKIVK